MLSENAEETTLYRGVVLRRFAIQSDLSFLWCAATGATAAKRSGLRAAISHALIPPIE